MKLSLIQEDKRGSIEILEGLQKYPEVTVFTTKAGYARGGCIHNINEEFVVVIEGSIEYVCYTPTGMSRTKMFTGDSIRIPKSTPHYFISWTPSIVMEWGCSIEEKKEKHKDFRAIVDEINLKQESADML
jgi:hypothetical protein